MKLCALRLSMRIPFLAVLLPALLVLACQDPNRVENEPTGPVTVKIPVAQSDGSYKLQTVELDSLDDMKLLRGEAAHFHFSPAIVDGHIEGFEPRVHLMRTSDGTYIAQDSLSLQLLTLYANFEGLMKMDAQLGVKDLNTWPRPVAVNTNVVDADGRVSRDNARYSGKLDAFLFEPYNREDLPLMVNAGVIGHEHFHSIFYKMVLKSMGGPFAVALKNEDIHDSAGMARQMGLSGTEIDGTSEPVLNERDLYHLTLLRGMNEGLADVWGWIFSGDTNFVGRSLTMEKGRDLSQATDPLPSMKTLEDEWAKMSTLNETMSSSNNPYVVGSIYAKTMHELVKVSLTGKAAVANATEPQLKQKLALAILGSLPKLNDAFSALKKNEKISPSRLLEILSDEIDFLNADNCEVLKAKVANEVDSKICAKFEKKTETK